MLYTLLTCVVALLFHVARGYPSVEMPRDTMKTQTRSSSPSIRGVTINSVPAHPNITLGSSLQPVSHPDAVDTVSVIFPATLVVCNGPDCDTAAAFCEGFDLLTTSAGVCFPALPIVSAMILQQSGEGLPFPVYVGTAGCGSILQMPAVNLCFNFGGEVLDTVSIGLSGF